MLKTITALALAMSFSAHAENDFRPESYFAAERSYETATPVRHISEIEGRWEGRLSASSSFHSDGPGQPIGNRFFVTQIGIHSPNILNVEESFTGQGVVVNEGPPQSEFILSYSARLGGEGFTYLATNVLSRYVTTANCRLIAPQKLICRRQTRYETYAAGSLGVTYLGYVRK